jgi:hypothetical protein
LLSKERYTILWNMRPLVTIAKAFSTIGRSRRKGAQSGAYLRASSQTQRIAFALVLLLPFTLMAPEAERESIMAEQPRAKEPDLLFVPLKYRERLAAECLLSKVPVELAAAVAYCESAWNEKCVSGPNLDGSYDLGLMQLNSYYLGDFARHIGKREFDPFDYGESIAIGVRKLRELYDMTGSWYHAVIAYNAGMGAFRRGAPKRSYSYAEKVVYYWRTNLEEGAVVYD